MSSATAITPLARVTKRRLLTFAAVHVLLDYVLLTQAWIPNGQYFILCVLSVPLAQCSLVAIWAASGSVPLLLRFAMPIAAAVSTWMIMMGMLSWGGNDSAAPGWAIVFGTQTVTLVATLHLLKHGRRRKNEPREADTLRSPFAFDLRTMMLWITTVGLAFGFVQYGRVNWNWTEAISEWEYLDAMPLIGLLNAAVALLWLWVFSSGGILTGIVKSLLTTAMMALMCVASARLINWILDPGSSIELSELFLLICGQSIPLVLTMGGLLIFPSRSGQSRGGGDEISLSPSNAVADASVTP